MSRDKWFYLTIKFCVWASTLKLRMQLLKEPWLLEDYFVHIVYSADIEHMKTWAQLDTHRFSIKDVRSYFNEHFNARDRGKLLSASSYARFLIPETLQNVNQCLWLDSDTIIRGDVVQFMKQRKSSKVLSAFPRQVATIPASAYLAVQSIGISVAKRLPSFNAGILVINLKSWWAEGVTKDIQKICKLNAERGLWKKFGSQPPLLLRLGGQRFEQLSNNLYEGNLGYQKKGKMRQEALFLHWNGIHKPWLKNGYNQEHWQGFKYE